MEMTSITSVNDPIFIAYAALTLMALLPIYIGSFSALQEIKVRFPLRANSL